MDAGKLVGNLTTPIPDPELIFLVNGHRDQPGFAASRRATAQNILDLLNGADVRHQLFRSILDFGCGCGRVLAGWEGMLDLRTRLYGCDINDRLIAFCQENIKFAETIVSTFLPPLPYQSEQFDFVYAASVYTHLSLPALLQWTGELARILKPGGVAMVSYHGTYYAPTLAGISKEGSVKLAEDGYYVHLHGVAGDTWEGSNNYATFASPEFMRDLFKGFKLLKIYPGVSHGPNAFASYQDIMIFRRL